VPAWTCGIDRPGFVGDWPSRQGTGLWDLRLDLESVHYSPQWKQPLGLPELRHANTQCITQERDRMLGLVDDLLHATMAQLQALRTPEP
jgi:hypothetical protein